MRLRGAQTQWLARRGRWAHVHTRHGVARVQCIGVKMRAACSTEGPTQVPSCDAPLRMVYLIGHEQVQPPSTAECMLEVHARHVRATKVEGYVETLAARRQRHAVWRPNKQQRKARLWALPSQEPSAVQRASGNTGLIAVQSDCPPVTPTCNPPSSMRKARCGSAHVAHATCCVTVIDGEGCVLVLW